MSGAGAPLRRTRGDLIATAVIAVVAVAAVLGVVFTASVREVNHTVAEASAAIPDEPGSSPTAVEADWSTPALSPPGTTRPIVIEGVTVVPEEHGARGLAPDGTQLWSYTRADRELCAAGAAWSTAVLVFRDPAAEAGCGDAVSLHAANGSYSATRSAPAPDEVASVVSNSRVGVASPERVELWRSDLVRTVEYGDVPAKQEPEQQPHEECVINSALTRTELLAVTEDCPDDPEHTWLRFQATTPEDSRAPEMDGEVALASGSRLVAVGQDGAAVFEPGPAPRLRSFAQDGTERLSRDVADAPVIGPPADEGTPEGLFLPRTADLPHHMSWFDGERLYLMHPDNLEVAHVLEDATGTGVAVGGRLVYPTAEGLAVADWDTGKVEHTIPVDRAGYTGEVDLALAGDRVIERRGDELAALRVL